MVLSLSMDCYSAIVCSTILTLRAADLIKRMTKPTSNRRIGQWCVRLLVYRFESQEMLARLRALYEDMHLFVNFFQLR